MTTPIPRPPGGFAPSLRTLTETIRGVNGLRAADPADAAAADTGHGQPRTAGPRPQPLGLFEITSESWTYHAAATVRGEPAMWHYATARPVYFGAGDGNWAAAGDLREVRIWHPHGYPPDKRDDMRAPLKHKFMPQYGEGDWCWCVYNHQSGHWEVLDKYEDVWRFQLTEPMASCGQATAKLLLLAEESPDFCNPPQCTATDVCFSVSDPLGVASASVGVAQSDGEGGYFVPAGTTGYAKRFSDTGTWEVIQFGTCPCQSSSSSSSSSSDSSSSSSDSSESSSDSSSPSSSSSDSSVSSSSSSESSSSDSSASSSSASSESGSSSQSDGSSSPCNFTGVLTVGDGNLFRSGNSVCEGRIAITIRDGRICSTADAGSSCVYICCDDSSSSSQSDPSSSSQPSSQSDSQSSSCGACGDTAIATQVLPDDVCLGATYSKTVQISESVPFQGNVTWSYSGPGTATPSGNDLEVSWVADGNCPASYPCTAIATDSCGCEVYEFQWNIDVDCCSSSSSSSISQSGSSSDSLSGESTSGSEASGSTSSSSGSGCTDCPSGARFTVPEDFDWDLGEAEPWPDKALDVAWVRGREFVFPPEDCTCTSDPDTLTIDPHNYELPSGKNLRIEFNFSGTSSYINITQSTDAYAAQYGMANEFDLCGAAGVFLPGSGIPAYTTDTMTVYRYDG